MNLPGTALLRGVTALGIVLGVMSFVRPVASDGAEPAVEELAMSPALPMLESSDSLATEIVLANLFAANRTPPRRRYGPVDSAADVGVEPVMPDSGLAMSGGSGPIPALYGTVVTGGVDQALLHLSAASPGPRLYPVGGRDGGYRVVSIAPRIVVLAGPQGRVVLRLSSKDEERP